MGIYYTIQEEIRRQVWEVNLMEQSGLMKSTVYWSLGSSSNSHVPKGIPGWSSHRRMFVLPAQDVLLFIWFGFFVLCFFLLLLFLPSGYFSVYLSHGFYLFIASTNPWSLLSLCLVSWLIFCSASCISLCVLLCRKELTRSKTAILRKICLQG